MRFSWIGSDQENEFTVVSYIADGIGHRAASEGGGQTGHGWRVSSAGAMVHIIGAHYGTGKFPNQEIFFVGTAG